MLERFHVPHDLAIRSLFSKLNLKGMVTARYPLDRVADALADAASAKGIKTALAPNGD